MMNFSALLRYRMDSTYATKAGNTLWSFVKNVKHWVTTVGEPEVNKYMTGSKNV